MEDMFDGPEVFTGDGELSMHSFINYHRFQEKDFYRMQEGLREEIADDDVHDEIKEEYLKNGHATSYEIQGIGGPYLCTRSSRPMSLDPYLEYNPETDNFNVYFEIFDTEILEQDGTHYLPDQTDDLYDREDLRDFGLSIPSENFISMSYEQFQTAFEVGMTKFFEHCLKDKTFQERHPIIQQLVELEQAKAKETSDFDATDAVEDLGETGIIIPQEKPSIQLQDLLDSDTRREAVHAMTEYLVQHDMNLDQVDNIFSEMKMAAIFHAEQVMRDMPMRGDPTQGEGR